MLRKQKLNKYFYIIKGTILKNQNSITGLIPSESGGNHAWVRDNCYAVLSIWGLALAYRKMPDLDEDRTKGYELEKCAIKLMRGLLTCFMKQSGKVEAFKSSQKPGDCLHAKYDSRNCNTVVGDYDWGHLQIDSISLYLLTIAQMTASGLHIIWTHDEVSFIQNLVFYIEMAYRIPDYGIWERGDKTNHGLPELNSSSVGIAKAALEALSDLDLFGPHGGPQSVIQSFPDECQQCQAVLESMLPRESYSKELDSALLTVISYPAFAVNDEEIIEKTRDKICHNLLGKYGCKRFLRDGFRSPREDRNRLHYEPYELRMFENLECEWPMFFAYLALDACFRDDIVEAEIYMDKLEKLLVEMPVTEEGEYLASMAVNNGVEVVSEKRRYNSNTGGAAPADDVANQKPVFQVMPESYAVTKETMDEEARQPGSQERVASGVYPHLWGQSLYILAKLVTDSIVTVGEIDPLGRRMQLEPKPDLVVQVCVMVENEKYKKMLLKDNIVSQTAEELYKQSGIKVYPARTLIYILKGLGKCEALNLNGRVCKEVGILATSRLYLIGDHMVAFQPHFMDTKDFYVSMDYDFLVDVFRSNVAFLRRVWSSPGRPTLIIPIFSRFFKQDGTLEKSILTTLMKVNSGYVYGTRVKLGTLSNFISTSFVTKLSFLHEKGDDVVRKLNPNLAHSPRKIDVIRQASLTPNDVQATFKPAALRRKSVALTNAILCDLEGNENYNNSSQEKECLMQQLMSVKSPDEDVTLLRPSNLLKHSSKQELKSSAAHLKSLVSKETTPMPAINLSGGSMNVRSNNSFSTSTNNYGMQSGSGTDVGSDIASMHTNSNDQPPQSSWLQGLSNNDLINVLQRTNELAEQAEILFILYNREGLDWQMEIGPDETYTIKQMLIEFYEKAGEANEWWLVRFISGLLRKRVDVLAKSLTDLLIRQKQVTVGLPPEPREIVITSPMGPKELSDVIQAACGEDYAMSMLTQEIMVYLAMFARTEPQLLSQMLRLRIGLIIQVMASELARARSCNASEASNQLFDLSPSQTKLLLQHILSGREFFLSTNAKERKKSVVQSGTRPFILSSDQDSSTRSSDTEDDESVKSPHGDTVSHRMGQWIRRRKIDGALNRVPSHFYERLWRVMTRMEEVYVANRTLSNNLTKEMTMGEIKFALQIESIINRVPVPEYRQLIVEAMSVLASVIEMDADRRLALHTKLSLDDLVSRANQLFLKDQEKFEGDALQCCIRPGENNKNEPSTPTNESYMFLRRSSLPCKGAFGVCIYFYDTSPSGRYGTMSYMLRALAEKISLPEGKNQDSYIDCQIQ